MSGVCFALLCADRVITENNGKKGLIGVFSGFHFPQFPSLPTQWFIYAGLANLPGENRFSINLVHDETQSVLLSLGGDLNVKEGEESDIELVVPVMNLVFQRPGAHTLILNVEGIPYASRVLRVTLHSPGPTI
ncbi:MAG TPA: hypothetical protein VMW69_13720 [Spirochaetia bacterium]|nr:hypothetical protein [Spirochaetia bacterium]